MKPVGIDKLCFRTSPFYLNLEELAIRKKFLPDRYQKSIHQRIMSIPTPDQDIVTFGTEAALHLLSSEEKSQIGFLLIATETSIDQSMSAGIYIHELLNLSSRCKTLEIKQACFSGMAAIGIAQNWVHQFPDKKALVIATDIARYELDSSGEPTQGCGAVAILISTNPKIASLHSFNAHHTKATYDFYRPNKLDIPVYEGKKSIENYLKCLQATWLLYKQETQLTLEAHKAFCFHTPYPKLARKALQALYEIERKDNSISIEHELMLQQALIYPKQTGNTYTASAFISLLSLLEANDFLTHSNIGIFSYGSGHVGEFFLAKIQPGYKNHLIKKYHTSHLLQRNEISYETYVKWWNERKIYEGLDVTIPSFHQYLVRHSATLSGKRVYEVNPTSSP